MLLLPEAVDDYVGTDNPVRFIEAFVDGLDLAAAWFARVLPKATGRPGYDPADLLKLYVYGYLNRVRSSRRLEAETHRNVEVIWLLRHLKPDSPDILDRRRETVEHPFGTIKQWMGQGAFLMRRLENVRGEFSLTALAYNIRRTITLVGVPDLIATARA
ncbi:transposase [Lichenifustis flavocetrariae]